MAECQRKVTPRMLRDMQRLRAEGQTYRAITRQFNLSMDTVYRWLNPAFRERRNRYHVRLVRRRACP